MAGESRKRKLGADVASPSASTVSGSFTCPVCLDIFTAPKILTCAHTFCLKCLEDVADRYAGGVFPCPSCRDFIRIPRGGVSAFKTNFYIKPEDLEKARKGLFCKVHPARDLELFCTHCNIAICFECKYDKHGDHETQSLPKAKAELAVSKARLDDAVLNMQKRIDGVEEEMRALSKKEEVMQHDIRARHAEAVKEAVKEAGKARDDMLCKLADDISRIQSQLSEPLQTMRVNLFQLLAMQREVADSSNSVSITEVRKTVTKFQEGSGPEAAVEKLIPQGLSTITRPILHGDQDCKLVEEMYSYIGGVFLLDTVVSESEVNVKEHIPYSQERSAEQIFSLCPMDDGSVWVSYRKNILTSESRNPERLDRVGKAIATETHFKGETNFKMTEGGTLFYEASDRSFYVKSGKLVQVRTTLRDAMIQRLTVLSEDPLDIREQTESMISCARVHACDMDEKEKFVAVVEDRGTLNAGRQHKVLLFQLSKTCTLDTRTDPENTHTDPVNTRTDSVNTHTDLENTHTDPVNTNTDPKNTHTDPMNTHTDPVNTHTDPGNTHTDPVNTHTDPVNTHTDPVDTHTDPVDTYTPPDYPDHPEFVPFHPTDVCFYKLGGQEVLLVSDEACDAIHVLHVQEGKLRFLRYLSPGCPLLLQPSALNVDSKGRLWVACRGGSILVCTPCELDPSAQE